LARRIAVIQDSCFSQTLTRIRADSWIYLAILVYTICGLLLLDSLGARKQAAFSSYLPNWPLTFLVTMPLFTLLVEALLVVRRFGRRPLAFRRAFSAKRLAHLFSGMALMMALILFQGTFTSIKNVFPLLHGGSFPYDRLHANIDAWLHFGHDPWRLLYAVGRYDIVRDILDWNYGLFWAVVCFGALFFAMTSPRAETIRSRYIIMFMLVWILCGNILAGIFLSAGPAFYGAVTGDTARFADQLAFLAGHDSMNSAATYQHYLWMLYVKGDAGFASGISAFPSVHVGTVTMTALFAAEHSRRLAAIAFTYLAVILVSSVYLGWHYAIDCYVSLVVVAACYFAVKKCMALRETSWAEPALEPTPTG